MAMMATSSRTLLMGASPLLVFTTCGSCASSMDRICSGHTPHAQSHSVTFITFSVNK